MTAIQKPLRDLTASDLMSRQLTVLREDMPLREAADVLVRSRTSGAPVVDAAGRCVGMLSAVDFLGLATTIGHKPQDSLPRSCSYQTDCRLSTGEVVTLCTLPPGACPIQGKGGEDHKEIPVCREPHSVLTDWQIVELAKLPSECVRTYMTADPVTAPGDMPARTLARIMIDTHVHRVIIVDAEGKPAGIVSSTDILAAVAYNTD